MSTPDSNKKPKKNFAKLKSISFDPDDDGSMRLSFKYSDGCKHEIILEPHTDVFFDKMLNNNAAGTPENFSYFDLESFMKSNPSEMASNSNVNFTTPQYPSLSGLPITTSSKSSARKFLNFWVRKFYGDKSNYW
ncbi:2302_t:CDS:2 [Ambispora leptoticha]|uniref:2302_t:CDS:1 n=1 Tax=Ambispora leptoticha TaxID=144679 RepID=A0A9N8WM37_9GLOM|nr:2302_t:CDS:2 [Ambispora leptoticha]